MLKMTDLERRQLADSIVGFFNAFSSDVFVTYVVKTEQWRKKREMEQGEGPVADFDIWTEYEGDLRKALDHVRDFANMDDDSIEILQLDDVRKYFRLLPHPVARIKAPLGSMAPILQKVDVVHEEADESRIRCICRLTAFDPTQYFHDRCGDITLGKAHNEIIIRLTENHNSKSSLRFEIPERKINPNSSYWRSHVILRPLGSKHERIETHAWDGQILERFFQGIRFHENTRLRCMDTPGMYHSYLRSLSFIEVSEKYDGDFEFPLFASDVAARAFKRGCDYAVQEKRRKNLERKARRMEKGKSRKVHEKIEWLCSQES